MKQALGCLFFGFVLLFSTIAFCSLRGRVLDELPNNRAYPCPSVECPTQESIGAYQFIFVDGFLSDRVGTSFFPLIKVLTVDFNIRDVSLIRPDSANSIVANSVEIFETIKKLRKLSPHKKALIISHSKGGAETLLMVLNHTELFTMGLISDVVVIDGAINGTPLADLWHEFCKIPDLPKTEYDFKLCAKVLKWSQGLDSLKPSYISPLINSAMRGLSKTEFEIESRHLWSVQSVYGSFMSDSMGLYIPHLYLNFFGENDGVILTAMEKFPRGFGHDMGSFETDHNGLLSSSDNPIHEAQREAFARALVREMVDPKY